VGVEVVVVLVFGATVVVGVARAVVEARTGPAPPWARPTHRMAEKHARPRRDVQSLGTARELQLTPASRVSTR
jgi:hypothetical protein